MFAGSARQIQQIPSLVLLRRPEKFSLPASKGALIVGASSPCCEAADTAKTGSSGMSFYRLL
ncbi:MAG: hypothetical protein ACOYM3_22225 [Terrimicrobiaceae bacterium]